jgi:phytoene dehydrogenase-like protein
MVKSLWKSFRAKRGSWLVDLARLVLSSPREFLEARFESEKLKVMKPTWGMHLDFAPDTACRPLVSNLESMAVQSFDMVLGQAAPIP